MKSYEFVLGLDSQDEIEASLDRLMKIDGIMAASLRQGKLGTDGGYPKVVLMATRDIKDELLAWYYGEPTESDIADFDEVHVIA